VGAWGEVARVANKNPGARNFVVLTLNKAGRTIITSSARGQETQMRTQMQMRKLGQRQYEFLAEIELKSLILAQIERWRHALHMQVERQRGGNPGGEWRTGE
jgi:hypothetical protein